MIQELADLKASILEAVTEYDESSTNRITGRSYLGERLLGKMALKRNNSLI